jgi:putative oxidoreductase
MASRGRGIGGIIEAPRYSRGGKRPHFRIPPFFRRQPPNQIESLKNLKIAAIIARTLLGLIFVVFGLNAFFNFIPLPPPKGELAGDFMKALLVSHYLYAVKCFEISGGLLLLSGRFTALGLTLVGPVIVNILFFHTFLDPSGLPMAIVLAVLGLFLLGVHRHSFAGLLLKQSPVTKTTIAKAP